MDGNASDWGIDILTGDWSVNETCVPDDGVEFIVEDIVRHRDGGLVAEPYRGEEYDLEAKYLEEDDEHIYILIMTSLAPDATGDSAPGDLALDLDGNSSTGEYGYEYGVKLGTNTGLSQWEIGYLPNWTEPYYVPENRPSVFKGYLPDGHGNGTATGAYVDIHVEDNGKPNYGVEMAIHKDKVGMAGKSLKDPQPRRYIYAMHAGMTT